MERLPLRTKLIFGLGGMGMNLCDMVWLQWIYMRYAPDETHALVPAAVLGAIIMAARVGECFYNIFVGHTSDNLRSKRGRRIPFMRAATVPLALVFFFMFIPPSGCPAWFIGLYIFVLLNLYLFCYAAVITPYLSLLPELTSDLDERVALTISQSVFIMFASIIFSLMGSILKAGGWVAVAGVVAFVTIAALMPAALIIREKPRDSAKPDARPPLFESMRLTLQNPAFWHIALSTSVYWFSLNMIIAVVPMWVIYVLGRPESDVTVVMIPFLVMNVAGFFLFNILIKRFGKYAMFLVTLFGSGLAFLSICGVGHMPFVSEWIQTILVVGLIGVPVSGFMVIPFALLADAVDYDEQCTGQRREAIYFSMQGVTQKLMLGLSAMAFPFLVFYGGQPGARTATALGVKLVALAAFAGCVASFLFFLKYPLREREGKVCLVQPE